MYRDFVSTVSRSSERAALDDIPVTLTAVRLIDGGVAKEISSSAPTVRELLLEQGTVLEPSDVVTPDLETPLEGVLTEVTITRVQPGSFLEEVAIPHTQSQVEDPTLLIGEQKLVQQGIDGVTRNLYQTEVTSSGEEISRVPLATLKVSDPVEHIIAVGTKAPAPIKKVAPAPIPAAAAPEASAPVNVTPGSARALGLELTLARGWDEAQFQCLDKLWTKESGWNFLAENKSSGAYGIPQSLPGSKMASVAGDWRTNPSTQITWGLNYITGRYETPCGAWAKSQASGWY